MSTLFRCWLEKQCARNEMTLEDLAIDLDATLSRVSHWASSKDWINHPLTEVLCTSKGVTPEYISEQLDTLERLASVCPVGYCHTIHEYYRHLHKDVYSFGSDLYHYMVTVGVSWGDIRHKHGFGHGVLERVVEGGAMTHPTYRRLLSLPDGAHHFSRWSPWDRRVPSLGGDPRAESIARVAVESGLLTPEDLIACRRSETLRQKIYGEWEDLVLHYYDAREARRLHPSKTRLGRLGLQPA